MLRAGRNSWSLFCSFCKTFLNSLSTSSWRWFESLVRPDSTKASLYEQRGKNRRNYNVAGSLDEENSSACLKDEINSSSTQVDHKAQETLSASYCKLKSVTEGNNPVDKPKETSTANSDSTIMGFRLFDMEVLWNVLSLLRCYERGEMDVLFMQDELNRKGCASSLR